MERAAMGMKVFDVRWQKHCHRMTCQVDIGEFFIVEWIIFIYLFVEEKGRVKMQWLEHWFIGINDGPLLLILRWMKQILGKGREGDPTIPLKKMGDTALYSGNRPSNRLPLPSPKYHCLLFFNPQLSILSLSL